LFLIVFLLVHLTANLFVFGGAEAYNAACHFMDTNPIIKIMVPFLAVGFAIHIIYAVILTMHNNKARPVKYAAKDLKGTSEWASRNMFVLGVIVLGVLCIHLTDFWANMQLQTLFLGKEMEVLPFDLIINKFTNPLFVVIYIVWVIALWFHLTHGFWSAFQSIGLCNQIWIKRWKCVARLYAIVIALGFISIPLYVFFCL
ncbi:MAG: succinate dehydrogenase cytochrome b subunit, partial [Rikenellaceae bacterium]